MIATPRTFNRTSLQDIRDHCLELFRSIEDDSSNDVLFRDCCFQLAVACDVMDARLARSNQKE